MSAVEGGARPSTTERLRRVEALTEAALAHLGVEDLLVELLERIREVLDADTAVVLLLDRATGDLVATAASGIEEEVREGVRIPWGEGFAGRVAAEARPIVIDDVVHSYVRNPILREKGLRALLGAPLITESRVIGVLHVGSLSNRRFGAEDIDLLEMVAHRVALAVQARRAKLERAAAAALQRSLIPARLPAIAGLDLAGRYLPSGDGGVGGDWYDVFSLPAGGVGIAIGDVVGRGLPAAVVMGRLRSALRAYALESSDPADVLDRLDRKLQYFEAGQMTTALYAVLDPTLTTLEISTAGHPLPMVVAAGSEAAPINAPVDPPLGVTPGISRRKATIELPPGAVLAFFTDGLVERRGESLDHGFERLRDALAAGSAERTCLTVMATLLGDAVEDDAAMLVVRRDDGGPMHLEVPAVPASVGQIRTALRRWLPSVGASDEGTLNVLLAVGEATTNVVEHAYGPGGGSMQVEFAYSTPDVVATIRDTGRWRSPRGDNRGRGMLIMERCADEVTVDRTANGTEVRLRFRFDQVGPR
jgi:anti-sigma regulatory factor (Ser/Thr protein kinase)/putative methionine-R-sulfoxide reductase with GAF domain